MGGIIIFSLIFYFGIGGDFSIEPLLGIAGIIFVFGLSWIVKTITISNQKLVMDRMNGLFSYPNFWSNNPVIIQFKNVEFLILYKGKTSTPTLIAPYSNWFFNGFTFISVSVINTFSFYVWYMDKNRPLPPGSAFDPYRKKDFERRKVEGFPPPLYRSTVPTPEATPEQQAEREKHWKEEDYMCPEFKTEPNAQLFDRNIHKDWRPFQYEKEPIRPESCNAWHRYELEIGGIVYMRTNDKAEGYIPPVNVKYEERIIRLQKAWWE